MTSERQVAANRANAQKSTGPRSLEGQRRAALNATRHGLLQLGATEAVAADARARAELYCEEDPALEFPEALMIAAAVLQGARVARAQAAEIERALSRTDPTLPWSVREDLARIAALSRLVALDNYERRSGGALRRQLRKLGRSGVAISIGRSLARGEM